MIIFTLFSVLGCSPSNQHVSLPENDSGKLEAPVSDDVTLPNITLIQRAAFHCSQPELSVHPIQARSLGEDWEAQRRGGDGELHGWGGGSRLER